MAIFCMGDTHGDVTIWPLYMFNYDCGAQLTKDDYVIVCGDFDMLWNYEQTGVNVVGNEVDECWMPEELWLLKEYEKAELIKFFDGNYKEFVKNKICQQNDYNYIKIDRNKISQFRLWKLLSEIDIKGFQKS